MQTLLLVVLFTIISAFLFLFLISIQKIKPITFKSNEEINKTIIPFHTEFYRDPYPQQFSIENEFACTPEDPKPCVVDDITTLIGCKNLAVTCKEFKEDTKYIDDSGNEIIIKKTEPGHGIALAVNDLTDSCNIYHGDLVLISTNPTENQYGLLCMCKNPGYIGNLETTGNCETIFICNGHIDDINQPIESVNCECEVTKIPDRYADGTPYCRSKLVKDITEDDIRYIEYVGDTTSTEYFNPTVEQNLKIKKVLNPCKVSLFGNPTNGELDMSLAANGIYACKTTLKDKAMPIDVDILKGAHTNRVPSTTLSTVNDPKIYHLFKGAGLTEINTFVAHVPELRKGIVQYDTGVIRLGRTMKPYFDGMTIIGGTCTGHWPGYTCGLGTLTALNQDDLDLPRTVARPCPSAFLWSNDNWVQTQKYFANYPWLQATDDNDVIKSYRLEQSRFDAYADGETTAGFTIEEHCLRIRVNDRNDYNILRNS